MVHPYYSNYPSPYYQFHHHFLSRFVLFGLSVVMIVMAILDYVYVYQTWYTTTINAVTIFAGVCGILCCIFVSFTLLEFTCLLFFVLFGVQLASLIYRGIMNIPHNSWGYSIAMCAILFAAWLVTTHLIRWFHAEIISGTYAGPEKATGGGATTNVAITQPNQQQPIGYAPTTTPRQYGTDPSYPRTYAAPQTFTGTGTGVGPNNNYTGTGPNPTYTGTGTGTGTGLLGTGTGTGLLGQHHTNYATGGNHLGTSNYTTGGPSAAYPDQRTYPAGTVQV